MVLNQQLLEGIKTGQRQQDSAQYKYDQLKKQYIAEGRDPNDLVALFDRRTWDQLSKDESGLTAENKAKDYANSLVNNPNFSNVNNGRYDNPTQSVNQEVGSTQTQNILNNPQVVDPNVPISGAIEQPIDEPNSAQGPPTTVPATVATTQEPTKPNESKGGIFGNLLGGMTAEKGLGLAGGLAGAGIALYNNSQNKEDVKWEGRAAQDQNTSNRERILAQDPEANRRTSELANRQAEAGALRGATTAAANRTATTGGRGVGGSALAAGINASAAYGGTAAQFAQGRAGLQAQKASEEAQINGQLAQGTGQRLQIDDSKNYAMKNDSILSGVLPQIQAGIATGGVLSTVNNSKKGKLEVKDGKIYEDGVEIKG